jgi:hypothetical protein
MFTATPHHASHLNSQGSSWLLLLLLTTAFGLRITFEPHTLARNTSPKAIDFVVTTFDIDPENLSKVAELLLNSGYTYG